MYILDLFNKTDYQKDNSEKERNKEKQFMVKMNFWLAKKLRNTTGN